MAGYIKAPQSLPQKKKSSAPKANGRERAEERNGGLY